MRFPRITFMLLVPLLGDMQQGFLIFLDTKGNMKQVGGLNQVVILSLFYFKLRGTRNLAFIFNLLQTLTKAKRPTTMG